jgi:DNA repair and recombination RAD54-like protein
LIGREPGASDKDRNLAAERSTALSVIVNKFVLRRTNALLSAHLPPKVIEVVCCKMTPLQTALYEHFIRSKAVSSVLNEDQNKPISQVLPLITSLKKLCNHPKLVYDEARQGKKKANASLLEGVEDFFPPNFHRQAVSGFCPDMSGKMEVLDRLLVLRADLQLHADAGSVLGHVPSA